MHVANEHLVQLIMCDCFLCMTCAYALADLCFHISFSDLTNIFDSFLPQLLSYPNPVDPLNSDAAALYLHKADDYKKKIKGKVVLFRSPL